MKRFTLNWKIALSIIVLTNTFLFQINRGHCDETSSKALDIMEKVFETYEKLKSYSYINHKKGLDTHTKEKEQRLLSDAAKMGKKTDWKSGSEPQMKEGEYAIKFIKPYSLQMKIIKSDFTPSVLFGSLLTYRADKDPNVWWFKLKYSPIALKRSIESEDGDFLTQGWTKPIVGLKYQIKKAKEIKYKGEEEVNGIKCNVVEIVFNKDYQPSEEDKNEIKEYIKKLKVPKELEEDIFKGVMNKEESEMSSSQFWFDKEKNVLVKIVDYIDGKFYWQNVYKDVQLNNVSEEDF